MCKLIGCVAAPSVIVTVLFYRSGFIKHRSFEILIAAESGRKHNITTTSMTN